MNKKVLTGVLAFTLLVPVPALANNHLAPNITELDLSGPGAEIISESHGGPLFDMENAKQPTLADPNKVIVAVNGNSGVYFPDAQPFVNKDDRTMVPIRFVATELGADVEWIQDTKTVILNQGDTQISLTIGENTALVNGQEVIFDTEAILKDDRTFVPLRFVTETFGATVEWNPKYRIVDIYTTKK